MRGIEEVRRQVKGLRLGWRRRKRAGKGMLEAGMKLGGIILRKKGKLGGKNQRRTENSFSRRQIGGIMRGGAVGKENPGQLGNPIRGSAAAS
jgi:hypothetical protein